MTRIWVDSRLIVFSLLFAAALWSFGKLAYDSAYNAGYLAGMQRGWDDCNHPIADMKAKQTYCPGSDLPRDVALAIR